MIGYLKGQVESVGPESLILLAGGVGYDVTTTPAILASLAPGAPTDLWIYTQVREDAIQLYGFKHLAEKELFLSLIKVNGIGPKSAIQILGASSCDQIVALINAGDARGLSGLPKVGKKTAEQIVLTLKGKLVSAAEPTRMEAPVKGEIISALVNLGFRINDVEKAVAQMPADIDLENGIRRALAGLTI